MADRLCTSEGCDRPVRHPRRGLCGRCYQRLWKADLLGPLPPVPAAMDHSCRRHDPSPTCYSGCGCRCTDCRAAQAARKRDRNRRQAYGTYDPGLVDAGPVRRHVAQLRAGGMGKRTIAARAGINGSVLSKLIYGDRTRGQKPSRRISRENARRLLAVRLDLADGVPVEASDTADKLDEMIAGGFAAVELARYLSGDPNTKTLQVARGRTDQITLKHRRQVDELHRRWSAGQIVPRGRRSRHDSGPPPVVPLEALHPGPVDGCEDCGAEAFGGGRWCWHCFSARANPKRPTGCGTDAGYTRHRRAGQAPCQACRDAHTTAQQIRSAA